MANSSAQLRRLGTELRRLRESVGRTQGDVGAAIGRTHASVVNWERGKTRISKSDLVCLLAELHAPAEVRKGLEKLREDAARGTSSWATYGLPDWLRPMLSFEEDATGVTTFEPVLVPGLLQTEEYARAIHTAGRHKVAPEYVEKWVAARMRRQQRLSGPGALTVHAVIAEAVLRLEVGGPEVFGRQLERLCEAASADNITVQVLIADQGGYGGMASNFTMLHFADPAIDPPLGCFDGPLGGHLLSDAGDVATMAKMFDDLREMALPAEDSAELLATILAEHRRKGGTG
ncbi:helix-turn-helix domain-containing protein [Streptomyces millisiae]|uniref:Helix-turn-helix transcriptional regulator n=1 Tax=Streptomyces millisiae TaxID=3075542 RepID=A0ABU2LRU6_9ACTN|nr:helix-turn-helix transcriptional regulator [Streptomyces sp. DSM 44918]MDT0320321.1 helix-turn-helix transcriptional regulator [Streptomyces sp. DSM 44918]